MSNSSRVELFIVNYVVRIFILNLKIFLNLFCSRDICIIQKIADILFYSNLLYLSTTITIGTEISEEDVEDGVKRKWKIRVDIPK